MSLHTVNDVLAKANCSITSIFPTTLTASGVRFADGTKNVEIQCTCTDINGTASDDVQWYYPNGTRIFERLHYRDIPGTPYYKRVLDNYVLVIPTFNGSYDGVYTCGIRNRFLYEEAKATVNLTLDGKHIAMHKIKNIV